LIDRFGPAGAQKIIQRKIAQRRAARVAEESAGQVQAAADRGTSGASGALPHLDAIQKSFGKHDVSKVKAHTDGAAAEGAAAMGAEAFASGEHIAFAGAPSLRTAAHEAAHVVQQRGGVQLKCGVGAVGDAYEQHADEVAERVVRGESAEALLDEHAGGARSSGDKVQQQAVQRLVKDNFPWNGIIINTESAALRSSPHKDAANPHDGTVADLPKGTRLKVTARSSNWLQVEVTVGGALRTGYVSQELVDDAVAAEMHGMLGKEGKWHASQPGSGNTFEKWASAPSETAAPPLGPATTINCWEMILYAAFQTGAIKWSFIHDLYANQPMGAWVSRMTSAGTNPFVPGTSKLNRGDLVFFNGLAHVALATGTGDEVFTFWPPPNTPFTFAAGGTVDKVKTSTIAVLAKWMKDNGLGSPTVTFGAPAW
jgi:hypothetical protein